MNLVKFYRTEGKNTRVAAVRVAQGTNPDGGAKRPTLASVEDQMAGRGFTRRRPFPPHRFMEQRPGYRQPSQHVKRIERQAARELAQKE